MHHLAAVASREKHEDDDSNSFPETGFLITYSPTKTYSKNKYNMFLNNHTAMLLTICLVSLYLPQHCLATLASSTSVEASTLNLEVLQEPPEHFECPGIDIRNECEVFEQLRKCTVVTGPVVISLVRLTNCNISDLVFENLREITGFLFFSNVDNLKSLRNMFPNLIVIRGRRLFTNYALVINDCDDLEKIEFESLIALQRGTVLIVNCLKLCFTEKVNWNRLALSRGRTNLFLDKKAECPNKEEVHCSGCKTESCWSNFICQKFETDSVISPMQDTRLCHQECLGGCYNRTAQGCAVCKGYTDHGTCVKECPHDKYASSLHLRCYTREECADLKYYIHKNECVDYCPVGYKENDETRECISCDGALKCPKICCTNLESVSIANIAVAQQISGCEIVNCSVVINIYEFFDPRELTEHLNTIKEITGFLKINKSPYLTSLDFLANLEKVHGNVLEQNQYSVVIYNNKNLTELWNVKPEFEILNGGMYIHANDKLCNRLVRQFRQSIIHDMSLDSIQKTDQEVFCSPAIINLYVQPLNHTSILLYWAKDQTYSEVEIIYRAVSHKEILEEKSELDTEVCYRSYWHRELKFAHELTKNTAHYNYVVENLEPHTRYAVLVKTFDGDDDTKEARSEIKYATTKYDVPAAPKILLKEKTFDKLLIGLSQVEVKSVSSPIVDFFLLEVYEIPDDKTVLDTRDYCDEPVMNFKDNTQEDYDDCCSRREREKRDQAYLSQLKREFACSLDQPENCKQTNIDYKEAKIPNLFYTKRFEAWETEFTVRYLQNFHLYVIQMRACNDAGCSSYSMLSARTNYSLEADKIHDFSFCKMNESDTEYRVYFSEPKYPNGYITSYSLHFRNHIASDNITTLVCVTRLEHARKKYLYVAHYNYSFNQAAIRVHSLGRHTFIDWKNITKCSGPITMANYSWFYFGFICLIAFVLFIWSIKKKICCVLEKWLCCCLPIHIGWRFLRPAGYIHEDRPGLVDGFETVQFHNLQEEPLVEARESNESE